MKTLPITIHRHGFDLRQISREGDVAVYEQSKNGRVLAFEVIRVQSHDGREIQGKAFPPAEFFPSSEEWGRLGWTCSSLARAMEKAGQLHSRAKPGLTAAP